MPELEEVKEMAKVVLVPQLQEKEFKSGKKGYYANGKLTIDGDRYQSQIMLVKIDSKKKGKK